MEFAVVLIAAEAGGILFRFLHLPRVVGMVVAGIFLSPFTPGFVVDPTGSFGDLAFLGAVFLMFAIGLTFDIRMFRKLGWKPFLLAGFFGAPETLIGLPGMGRDVPQEEVVRVRLPSTRDGEIFAIADQLLGASRIRVMCADGKSRLGRIPGKLKKRMWIREGDLLIVKPWAFQDEKSDIRHRYTKTESTYLSRRGILPKTVDIFR